VDSRGIGLSQAARLLARHDKCVFSHFPTIGSGFQAWEIMYVYKLIAPSDMPRPIHFRVVQ
jgi:hypothetical protein